MAPPMPHMFNCVCPECKRSSVAQKRRALAERLAAEIQRQLHFGAGMSLADICERVLAEQEDK